MGYEGIVARTMEGEIYKIKPIQTVDAVVIGVNKKEKLKEGKVTSLKTALINEDGTFITLCDVGSGLTNAQRKVLNKLRTLQVGEDDDTIYIHPSLIIEIEYQDTYKKNRQVRRYSKFVEGNYRLEGEKPFHSLRHPVFKRFRPDKTITYEDIGTHQLEAHDPK
jgi:ATP-dependent DNA ligase